MDKVMKLCPFCGKEHDVYTYKNVIDYDDNGNPITGEEKQYVYFQEDSQEKNGMYISPETWDNRPVEDDLRSQITSLREEIENNLTAIDLLKSTADWQKDIIKSLRAKLKKRETK